MNIYDIISGTFMILSHVFEECGNKSAFFKRFKTVPVSYFDVSSINGAHTIRSEIFNGHVVRDTSGRKIVVTEKWIDGKVHYIERSLFNSGTTDISENVEDILYSGSIENCWCHWHQMNLDKL